MRISIANQPEIERLSMPLKQSLATMAAAIQTGWNQQHHGDGTHGAVTASSASVTGTTVLGKLNLRSVTYREGIPSGLQHDLTVAGLPDVSCLRIVAAASPTMITGIDATGRQMGDVLLVLNCDPWLAPKDLLLLGEDTRSLAANRFCDTAASPGGAGSSYIVQGARGVWLVYDYQEMDGSTTPKGPRWRIIADA